MPRARPADDPFDALAAAPRGAPLALLAGCGSGPSRLYLDPVDVLTVAADEVAVAFDRLAEFVARNRERACVGWIGYDARDAVEPLPRRIEEDLDVPVLHFAAYDEWTVWPASNAMPEAGPAPSVVDVDAHCTRADYEARVAQVVEHIRAGDIFQANLTQPFSGRFHGDPRALFARLCAVSPAPFAAYIEAGAAAATVLSSSPEELVWREGVNVRTRPIKGTRPRAADPARDRALLAELLESEKDLAELAMIVDLLRNDFGKLAVPGSVRVGPFPEHDSFAQVHHLFASVAARLPPATGHVDVLRAIFPGGSITGAPKLRSMEVIESLEWVRRGVYTGAIGRIGPGDSMHLSVAIRTMTLSGSTLRFNVGGGITADSDPAAEYVETLDKAAGMLQAVGSRTTFR